MPPLFWATSVFEPLWFAMGAFDYMTISLKVVFYIELMAPEQHQWMDTRPMCFYKGLPLSVWQRSGVEAGWPSAWCRAGFVLELNLQFVCTCN